MKSAYTSFMAKHIMCLAPKDMLELCDWVERTDPTLMVEGLIEVMRDQANDAIRHTQGMLAAAHGLGAKNLRVLMEVTIEGADEHIMYAMMRWKAADNGEGIGKANIQRFTIKEKGAAAFATTP